MMFANVFDGRSVFVTGHTGFKGSWLCMWLHQLGARVTGYALDPPTDPSNFEICGVHDLLESHHVGDLGELDQLREAIDLARPEFLFHLAAQSIVRKSYQVPLETFETNVMGTAHVLDVVRELGRPCNVVCVTSDKCYENREQVWGYREADAMGERDPYGASKGAAELVIRGYRNSYFPPDQLQRHGVKLASGRAGNVLGGGDFTPDALVVDLVKALGSDNPARIRSPEALRPWQHVLQALSGYLTLAERLAGSTDPALMSGWNFGPLPGNELPVREVVEIFLQEWESGSWIDASDAQQPHEAQILRLAIDKALWQLAWRPGWDIHQTLRQTAAWYRAYYQGDIDMRQLSLQQISAYEAAIANPIQPSETTDDAVAW